MKFKSLKYLVPFVLFAGAICSFQANGMLVWLPLILVWIVIPLLEFFLKADAENMSAAEEELVSADKTYDFILYLIVPLQYISLYFFISNIGENNLSTVDLVGRIGVMGVLCGSFGINVGHELGHRINKTEQTFAKILLLSSLYMHFFIEHNKGHHKNVATPDDPSSARFGEPVYLFYFRTICMTYLSAWHIASSELVKKGKRSISFSNPMLQFQLIQLALVCSLFFLFGIKATICFLIAALIGILLLETVNYIEHYGLQRKKTTEGNYERAMPQHSWNSNHVIGRLFLFELSRHSDHHYIASRKYQLLRHHDNSPQMPTGYPGMIIVALFPPIWFWIMNRKIKTFEKGN